MISHHETAEQRYKAWVNNKIMALIWVIERNAHRDLTAILKHVFFLEEIEHHFMDCHADYRVWRAFRYLKAYLRTYPHKKLIRQHTAFAMLRIIYEKLGFSGQKIPVLSFKDIKKSECADHILTPAA